MDDALGMHISQRVDNLCGIIADTFNGKGAHPRYSGLQFTIPREVQNKNYAYSGLSNADMSKGAVARLT